jgi:copper chaperone NosL
MTTNNTISSLIFLFLIIGSFCCKPKPVAIELGKDNCSFCKMSIADQHFGGEIISENNDVYKFDDVFCLLKFKKEYHLDKKDIKQIFLINYEEPHNFISAENAFLLKSNELHSPMGGDMAAFNNENKMKEALQKFHGKEISWKFLINQ